ncbi:MAG: hypothetical protein SGJ19_01185, partial [Planctomycetia bacterium]|nr:hypothetical protein [Planctomycetia bacterium]
SMRSSSARSLAAERGIVIPVRNDSGADRNRFDALAHDGAVVASGDNLPHSVNRPGGEGQQLPFLILRGDAVRRLEPAADY